MPDLSVITAHRTLGTHLLEKGRWLDRQLLSPYPIPWPGCGQKECGLCARSATRREVDDHPRADGTREKSRGPSAGLSNHCAQRSNLSLADQTREARGFSWVSKAVPGSTLPKTVE